MLQNARMTRRFHNPKVGGSIPPPATNKINNLRRLYHLNLGVPTPMPASYRYIGSNLAEFRITATLQQRDEYLGPKQLQVDGLSCCQIGSFGIASSGVGTKDWAAAAVTFMGRLDAL